MRNVFSYIDFVHSFSFCELNVKKKNVSFIEKLFRYFYKEQFKHDDYLDIIYERRVPSSSLEMSFFNTYMYYSNLMNNEITITNLSILYLGKDDSVESIVKDLDERKDKLESIIDVFFNVRNTTLKYGEEKSLFFSLMLLNYLFMNNGLNTIKFYYNDFRLFFKVEKEYQNNSKDDAYNFFRRELNKSLTQDKDYYKNLFEFHQKDIKQFVEINKNTIINEYKVKKLILYGSFSKNKERIDSDLDLAVIYQSNMSYDEKLERHNKLKQLFNDKFKRFTDIVEIFNMDDEFIKDELSTCVCLLSKKEA